MLAGQGGWKSTEDYLQLTGPVDHSDSASFTSVGSAEFLNLSGSMHCSTLIRLPLPQCFWPRGGKLRPWSEKNSDQNPDHARLWIYHEKEKLRPWSEFLGRGNSDHGLSLGCFWGRGRRGGSQLHFKIMTYLSGLGKQVMYAMITQSTLTQNTTERLDARTLLLTCPLEVRCPLCKRVSRRYLRTKPHKNMTKCVRYTLCDTVSKGYCTTKGGYLALGC